MVSGQSVGEVRDGWDNALDPLDEYEWHDAKQRRWATVRAELEQEGYGYQHLADEVEGRGWHLALVDAVGCLDVYVFRSPPLKAPDGQLAPAERFQGDLLGEWSGLSAREPDALNRVARAVRAQMEVEGHLLRASRARVLG